MARPKKGREIGATQAVAVRLTDEVRLALDALVARKGSTITDEVRAAIDAHIRKSARSPLWKS